MMHNLLAISPIDGRYHEKTNLLGTYTSEFALMKYRLKIEIEWFIFLSEQTELTEIPEFSVQEKNQLREIVTQFSIKDAETVKTIERTTHHDLKAIEYFLKDKIKLYSVQSPTEVLQDVRTKDGKPLVIQEEKGCNPFSGEHRMCAPAKPQSMAMPSTHTYLEFIHFACTSEDINNIAYALMLKECREHILNPALDQLLQLFIHHAHQYAESAMLARTHGQAATPTTLGKEFANFAARLRRQIILFKNIQITAKMNGATGNFNAHICAYPHVDWLSISKHFIENFGLDYSFYTTQIEPHDYIAEYSHALIRINTILLDFSRDMWGYISLDYFKQAKKAEQIGSSTMPHKINPIDFENTEGNLGIANALFAFFAEKLPISRWQRDLSDSTVLRNLGVAIAHSFLAYSSLQTGLSKLSIHTDKIDHELNQHWEVLTEAVQTILRKHGIENAYEQLKTLSHGKTMQQQDLSHFIQTLKLPEEAKQKLLALTPAKYIGLANVLAKDIK